ncbi:larval cuticle protein LCP-30-like [Toxorhynchites rutilus septentrionalis]|uniref:larval cuticle protein LCP-30-like n=1 Tax=Toxorhynchites rutilus septentrionalis TaxID=329112 RepID=UPI00247A496E|nr:larval cuticle protein LCP-30-like [Toxorhynchites rutilus septentrionalis]
MVHHQISPLSFSLLAVSCALAQSYNDGRYSPEQNQGKYDDGKYRPDNRGAYRPGDNGKYRGNGRVSTTRISTIGTNVATQRYTPPARIVTRPQVAAPITRVAPVAPVAQIAPIASPIVASNFLGYIGNDIGINGLTNPIGDLGLLSQSNLHIGDIGHLGTLNTDYSALLAGSSLGLGYDYLGGLNGFQSTGIHLPTPLDLPHIL